MNQTILLVFAHPDDETFTCGGSIAHWAEDPTTRIILYCATRGEAGKTGNPPRCTQEELGDVRAAELDRAASILGINHLVLRDYGDGKLKDLQKGVLARDIKNILDQYTPQRVITFPPDGISGHPDHQAVHLATLEAMKGNYPNTQLFYSVIPESLARKFPRPIHGTPDKEITEKINVSPYRKVIMTALQQHQTQHLSIERVFPGVMEGKWEKLRRVEYFQQVDRN